MPPHAASAPATVAPHTFTLGESAFLLDGQPFLIRSGEMHVSRIPRAYWRRRIRMAKAMGLNAIATYIFWNVHEPSPGRFNFSGDADLAAFVRIAQSEGMWVILRPGPYACAEWDFGGYPSWLLTSPADTVRSRDPRFLAATAAYLKRLGAELAPLQVTHGGPILMVQVENEYGSYGDDHAYMAVIRDQIRAAGFDVPLFTADGPSQMPNGRVDGALPAINGATDSTIFTTIRQFAPHGPFFVAEFYPGWLDHWGEPHQRVATADVVRDYDWMLSRGVSVNLYVFHGGTNFGFTSGANYSDHYQPQPTSYDYDAPLDESGRPTPKYFALRDVALRHLNPGEVVPPVPAEPPPVAVPRFSLGEAAPLLAAAGPPVRAPDPLAFEDLGVASGYVLYRAIVDANEPPAQGFLEIPRGGGTAHVRATLALGDLRDYAVVMLNGNPVAGLDRRHHQTSAPIRYPMVDADTLDLLVANDGRINYGKLLPDNRQGLFGPVTLGGRPVTGWEMFRLPMTDLTRLRFAPHREAASPSSPRFYRGAFTIAKPGDTFLDLRGFGKGAVWVNGHNLGRFWYIGPQQTLYLPGAWMKAGRNEVIVFDLEGHPGPGAPSIEGLAAPVLDQLMPDRLAPPLPAR